MKEKNKIAFGRLDLLRNDTLKNKKIYASSDKIAFDSSEASE